MRIQLLQTEELALIRIFDYSNRLPNEIRAKLFDPFVSHDPADLVGLFLAKALIEIGCDGQLVDRASSEDGPGGIGHTFEISLPLAKNEIT